MRFSVLKLFHKNQAGFSLIELLVALAISGIIGLSASLSSFQILNQTSRDTDYTAASRYATNAIYWLSRDALMAQTIDGCEGFPETETLKFTWNGWDNSVFSAEYSITNGELWRAYSDGVNTFNTLIAEYISSDPEMTSCTSADGTITLVVTSSVGEGDRIIDVTKARVITSRTKL